jgi:hypothetical protein
MRWATGNSPPTLSTRTREAPRTKKPDKRPRIAGNRLTDSTRFCPTNVENDRGVGLVMICANFGSLLRLDLMFDPLHKIRVDSDNKR